MGEVLQSLMELTHRSVVRSGLIQFNLASKEALVCLTTFLCFLMRSSKRVPSLAQIKQKVPPLFRKQETSHTAVLQSFL